MSPEDPTLAAPAHERPAFAALVALLLAPVFAHGLWRPLVHVFGASERAGTITVVALAITFVIAMVESARPKRRPFLPLGLGGLIAVGASVAASLGFPGLLTLLGVAALSAFAVRWLPPQLPPALDGLATRHKPLTALYVVLCLVAIISVARLSVFIGDPTRVDLQVVPGVKFLETHSCLSAYVHAATVSHTGVDNLYDARWWHGAHGMEPRAAGDADPFHPFNLDYYAYPPPFLLILAPLSAFEGDFPAQRALWFGLNGLFLAVGLGVIARWIGGRNAHRLFLLAPIFFGSLPILATLQVGNFQIAVVVLSMLAMAAFHQDRSALGGAMLAFAVLAKLSPGVLGIVLLAQRRWRAAAWTAGFGGLYLALSILTVGLRPSQAFLVYTLPRLLSGEALAFLDDDTFSIITNLAPFGLPFKLQLLGARIDDPWLVARPIARGYTLALTLLAVLAARGRGERRDQALTWLALLVLAALQSPFAPAYVTIGLLWAIILMAAEVRGRRGAVALVSLWGLITVILPAFGVPLLTAQSILQSLCVVAVPTWLIVRAASARDPAAQ